jgi:hypothetical protein
MEKEKKTKTWTWWRPGRAIRSGNRSQQEQAAGTKHKAMIKDTSNKIQT